MPLGTRNDNSPFRRIPKRAVAIRKKRSTVGLALRRVRPQGRHPRERRRQVPARRHPVRGHRDRGHPPGLRPQEQAVLDAL